MKQNFLFVTDTHFHIFTEFAKPDEKFVNSRFKEQIDALQKVFDIARENNAIIIHGGDLFHKRGSVDTRVYNAVIKVFISNQDVQVFLLGGNHDAVTNSLYSDRSIEPLGMLSNVRVFSKPERFLLNYVDESSEIELLFIPYGDETEELKTIIKEFEPNSLECASILVGHLGVEGAITGMHNHRLSGAFGSGDLHPEKFDYVLLGHYHKLQYFEGSNIMYGGSFMQHSFSDEGDKKGVHLITVDTKDKSNNNSVFIPLETKQFFTVKGDSIPKDIDDLLENHYVRFIGTKAQAKAVESLSEDIDLSNMRVMIEKEYKSNIRVGIDSSSSPEEVTKVYAEKYYPSSVKEAIECIREAKNLEESV